MGVSVLVVAGEAGGIHDAGVDEFIHDDNIVFSNQGADGANGGGVAGGEGQRGFGAFEGGEGFVQLVMRSEGAADETGSACARAEFFNRLNGGFFDDRFVGQAEIII